MMKTIVVALGGNALQRNSEKGTIEEQLFHIKETSNHLIHLLEKGHSLVITHGNGPQVGSILLKNEYCEDKLPPMPLDVCGAETQGMIGYLLQQQLYNHLQKHKRKEKVVTLCTQTLVHEEDSAFKHPTKPIGLFYTRAQANRLKKEKGWDMIQEIGKGYRRVVPSPTPVDIIEADVIKECINQGIIVIACGGGGVPVVKDKDGNLKGIEAVIDKDRTAAVLAQKVQADTLMILTDVEQVALHFGTPNQKNLFQMTVEEGEKYLREGEFGKGNMGPKVEAACTFIKSGGKKVLISSLEKAKEALEGSTGTLMVK